MEVWTEPLRIMYWLAMTVGRLNLSIILSLDPSAVMLLMLLKASSAIMEAWE